MREPKKGEIWTHKRNGRQVEILSYSGRYGKVGLLWCDSGTKSRRQAHYFFHDFDPPTEEVS